MQTLSSRIICSLSYNMIDMIGDGHFNFYCTSKNVLILQLFLNYHCDR